MAPEKFEQMDSHLHNVWEVLDVYPFSEGWTCIEGAQLGARKTVWRKHISTHNSQQCTLTLTLHDVHAYFRLDVLELDKECKRHVIGFVVKDFAEHIPAEIDILRSWISWANMNQVGPDYYARHDPRYRDDDDCLQQLDGSIFSLLWDYRGHIHNLWGWYRDPKNHGAHWYNYFYAEKTIYVISIRIQRFYPSENMLWILHFRVTKGYGSSLPPVYETCIPFLRADNLSYTTQEMLPRDFKAVYCWLYWLQKGERPSQFDEDRDEPLFGGNDMPDQHKILNRLGSMNPQPSVFMTEKHHGRILDAAITALHHLGKAATYLEDVKEFLEMEHPDIFKQEYTPESKSLRDIYLVIWGADVHLYKRSLANERQHLGRLRLVDEYTFEGKPKTFRYDVYTRTGGSGWNHLTREDNQTSAIEGLNHLLRFYNLDPDKYLQELKDTPEYKFCEQPDLQKGFNAEDYTMPIGGVQ